MLRLLDGAAAKFQKCGRDDLRKAPAGAFQFCSTAEGIRIPCRESFVKIPYLPEFPDDVPWQGKVRITIGFRVATGIPGPSGSRTCVSKCVDTRRVLLCSILNR